MGSKSWMLQNGLGTLLRAQLSQRRRFVDLFAGAGSVSWFVASNSAASVLSVDLQAYSSVLTGAVLGRRTPVDAAATAERWIRKAEQRIDLEAIDAVAALELTHFHDTRAMVDAARELCWNIDGGTIWNAYGGYYFSPRQAMVFDALRESVPRREPEHTLCVASLIVAASRCAAAPGHTAQPFAATASAGEFLLEAWRKSPAEYVLKALCEIGPMHAQHIGESRVADAMVVATDLSRRDLVFLDPPYSAVQYSRFYHVLETMAIGKCGDVDGMGRYPPPAERPISPFSCKAQAPEALDALLESLADQHCTVILTFPSHGCSNGLSGEAVLEIAATYFDVAYKPVKSRFSTLGGNNSSRAARHETDELILFLQS